MPNCEQTVACKKFYADILLKITHYDSASSMIVLIIQIINLVAVTAAHKVRL
ncbi:hypothetical protein RIEGSTA812A_PEG_877 [invertebrate metagenome]|uniref:Uncharacterized protein n=1 Tax=invertebrate metagenome TaxID=1711999 RepID=A0A484H6Y8_9ZZZZ